AANLTPTSTTFDNSTLDYTISSTDGFGIAGGTLVKNGSRSVTLAAPSSYAGGTTLNAGTLNLNHASAIGTGTLIINGGSIDNTSESAVILSTNNAQSWNADFEFRGTNDLNLGAGVVTLNANRIVTTNGSADLTVGGNIKGTGFGITKAGPGELVLAGANSYTGMTVVSGGTLTVTGSINAPNTANIGQISVGTTFENAVMRIVGGTVNASKSAAPGMVVGNAPGGAGVLLMEGGLLNAPGEVWVGSPLGGSGSMTVNAGSVTSGSWIPVGRNGSGTLNVNGGSVTVNGQNFSLGSFGGANGDVNLTGGTTTTTSTAANQGIFIVGEGGTGVLTVSGSAALNLSGALGVQLARGGTGNGYVNLNGGTITTPAVTKGAGTIGVFSFNGGTLRPTASNAAFMTGLTAAYVLQGGANIDTNGQNITIAQPLNAPFEKGISAISVLEGGSGYIHAPVVRISGGIGTGATAVANIVGGVLTGIT
ncbi:MAG: PEP-CTERM sorting domain-containing protein, partial [Verrucomicrobiaceae bacterium]